MHINITLSEAGNNQGSSSQLVSYLEKENRLQKNAHLEPEYWFNQERNNIQPYDVRYTIDSNIAKLSKDEAKFFLINISPSEKEIGYLKEQYGEDGAKQQLKLYANQAMNDYALNFKRNNIESNKDLVYFGKLENHRYYTFKDAEVKSGLVKKGDAKPGEQMHVQIIVSRKDASNSIKLSPLNNSRGKNQAHSLKVGQFDRTAFKQSAEKRFDKIFGYERELKETFRYANTLKHGNYEQRLEIKEKQNKEQEQRQQQFERQSIHQDGNSLLRDFLRGGPEDDSGPIIPKKKKQEHEQSRGMGL
jgi:hypothetical protein